MFEFVNSISSDKIPDIYFTYEYGKCTEITDNGIWECAIWNLNEGFIPYLKKSINNNFYDLCSPYGYNGIYVQQSEKIKECFDEFIHEAKKRNYVSFFIRFSPYLITNIFTHPQIYRKTSTFGISLQINMTNKDHLRMVRKAKKNGFIYKFIEKIEYGHILLFQTLYYQTMKRLNAKQYYFFSTNYFQKLYELCHNYLSFVGVWKENKLIACLLVFCYKPYIHYHLGASDEEYLSYGINNLVHQAVIEWAIIKKYTMYHLGGGIYENDGLHQFKKRISNIQYNYYQGKIIINQEIYSLLSNKLSITDFFPPYRNSENVVLSNCGTL